MEAGDLLASWRPALKQRWVARLRRAPAGPPGTGLVTPEMLVLMVDGSLDRLANPARMRPTLPQSVARRASPRAGCHCGLHLLLTYYAAGLWTLRETLPTTAGIRVPAMRTLLHDARAELAALCGVCRHRGGSLCLQPGPGARAGRPAAR
jgi:hypothetical protein